MKQLLIIALLLNINSFGTDRIMNTKKIDCESILKTGDKELIAQRGCCSHHHGVCGCSNGRDQCCDGVLSPSCSCNSIVPIEAQTGLKL